MKARWILFFLAVVSPFMARCCNQDSITVDGVPLALGLEVRTSPEQEESSRPSVKSGVLKPTIITGIAVTGWHQIADAAGSSLAQFSGASVQPALSASMGSIWRTESKQWKLEAQWGRFRCLTLDILNIDDSAFALAPDGQGGVEQWVQRTYDLGVELDTLPLGLEARAMQMASVSLSMGSRADGRGRKKWGCWGGLQAKWSRLLRSETEVERISGNGLPMGEDVLGSSRLDWVPIQTWTLGAHGAIERHLNPRWSALLCGEWNSGLRSHWALSLGVSHRWVH